MNKTSKRTQRADMICEWKWHWRPYFLDLSLVDKHNFLFFYNHNVKNITQLSSSKQRKHLYRSMDYFLHQHADIFVLANYLVITCVSLEFSSTKGGETTLTPIMGALSQWWVMTFHKSFAAATDSRAQRSRYRTLFPYKPNPMPSFFWHMLRSRI